MGIIGLLLGLAIGASISGFEGAILGTLIGWALGAGFGRLLKRHDSKVKGAEVETRLSRLQDAVQAIEQRLAVLESSGRLVAPPPSPGVAAPPLPSAEPMPAMAFEPEPTPFELSAASLPTDAVSPALAPYSEATRDADPGAPREATLAPRPPRAPREPSFIWRWFMGGNTVVRVGVVILFFGLAFLLKYAYEHTHVPPALRVTAVALGAVALLYIGWRLRDKRAGYALALQGGGVGVLYLTVFGALRLYQLIPPEAAFVLLFAIAALSAALAVLQNSQSLAALGASGGFLAPILASTGAGSHVMLFSYYLVLDAGILAIAWYKAWRPLNVIGFLFTFAIGTLWGARSYRADLFASTEPFLLIFFVIYLAIPILFARKRAIELKSYVDGTLVFGVPIVAFGLQTRLVAHIEYGAAYSALALSFVYLLLARVLYGRTRENYRLLVEAFLALGVVFGTLAIPLALDERWTSAAWALEGAAIVWAGVRQNHKLARAFGWLLQFAAGLAFLIDVERGYGSVPVLNSFYLGCVFVALGGLFSNWYLERHANRLRDWERAGAVVIFFWGLVWWIAAGVHEIDVHLSDAFVPGALLLFAVFTCAAFSILHSRANWWLAQYPPLALLPAMAMIAMYVQSKRTHPFAALGLLAWPVAFVAHLWLLKRHDERNDRYMDLLHAGQLWLVATIGAWEAGWAIDRLVDAARVWKVIAWALVPGLLLGLLSSRGERIVWPVRARLDAYLRVGCAPIALFLWLWVFYVNFTLSGDPRPLPYVPLINPLDLAQLAALLTIVVWLRAMRKLELADYTGEQPRVVYGALGLALFVMLNASLLRTLHFWADIPLSLPGMLESRLVQAALSIFWTVLALAAMVSATRLRVRSVWMIGAALMAVVVAKLFLVDLRNVGGVEAIVAFIAVGLLMLLIGYFSPVPPKISEEPR